MSAEDMLGRPEGMGDEQVWPADIVAVQEVLEGRGWQVEIVSQDSVEDLVGVDEEGLMKCVDGRLSDKRDQMRGPKTLGGVYALMAMRGQTDLESLKKTVKEVAAADIVPSVHGDDHHDEMGCGFFKLWSAGMLDGLKTPQFNGKEGRFMTTEAGGVYEELEGVHEEKIVEINFVPHTTLEPNEQRFIVDAWIADEFDINMGAYLALAAETVEKLNGPKVARLIVPNEK